jgi:hypothetical protein
VLDPSSLALACAATAVLRVGGDVVFYLSPDLLGSTGVRNVSLLLLSAMPVFLVLQGRRKFDRTTAAVVATIGWCFGSACFALLNVSEDLLTGAGLADPFGSLVVYYAAAGALVGLASWLSVRGSFACLFERSWQTKVWALPGPRVWLTFATCAGAAWPVACIPAFAGQFLPRNVERPLSMVSLILLFFPAVIQWMLERPGHPSEPPASMSLVEQRRWYCQRLDAEYVPTTPTESILFAGLSSGHLMVARVQDGAGSRWLACGGSIGWDRRVWRSPAALFDVMRPDLSPFMGLGPGWVVTTSPAEVKFAPEIAERLAKSVARCKIIQLSESDVLNQAPLVIEPRRPEA